MQKHTQTKDDEYQKQYHRSRRILIVDDDEALRSYLVKSLQSDGYEVDGVHNIDKAKVNWECQSLEPLFYMQDRHTTMYKQQRSNQVTSHVTGINQAVKQQTSHVMHKRVM